MSLDSKVEGFAVLKHCESPHSKSNGLGGCCCKKPGRMPASGVVLSILGIVGWLALPKCPLCLAAYVAIFSGLSISAAYGRVLYFALVILVAACFLAGAVRLGSAAWRWFFQHPRRMIG